MSRLHEFHPSRYPLLPLKNVVIFPRNMVTLLIARPRSIQAVEEAVGRDRRLVVTAHRDSEIDDPRPADLHGVGTVVAISSVERQASGSIEVRLEGLARVRLSGFESSRECYTVAADPIQEIEPPLSEAQVMIALVQELTAQYGEARGALPDDVLTMVNQATDAGHLADLLATQLLQDVAGRQALLEIADALARLEHVYAHMTGQIDTAAIERRIKERVREQIDKNQREYYLREQLKAIHDELGGDSGNEVDALRHRIAERGVPADVAEKLQREISRLERMPAVSNESTVARTYIETLLTLPWQELSDDRIDLEEAERLLDVDHHGMETVKERILDFLAVHKLTVDNGAEPQAQVLCLVGPPGVGKTSLSRSIATAMGRKFVRVSLGGVRDEADIRGHRRTYIGAMPGRLITAMKQAGTINPVILLDEIDKIASDYRGDPASALLEVLDPEQNSAFGDHFLDVPYDLSKVLFLTSANYLNQIPRPLRDRMEIIELSGYAEEEKVEIGRQHLLPRQLKAHGLAAVPYAIPPPIWVTMVRDYTREAGVRQLEREIAAICRRLAREVVRGNVNHPELTLAQLVEYLGPSRFGQDLHIGDHQIGLAIGLGVTEAGGEILPVEVLTMPGKGSLTLTGKAGDVMQESSRAALSYARSRSEHLRIDPDFQERFDIHIHLPEGATPKDGPSAGITMATALISALTRRPVRGDTAMTGEITLRGRVLAIGGLKDKALAAHRQGIRRIIAPRDNERDFAKFPATLRQEMQFFWASSMDQVIAEAILLDDAQVDSLMEGTAPAPLSPALPTTPELETPVLPVEDPVAAEGVAMPTNQ